MAGKYILVFSPNNWEDWVRYPLIICFVKEPRKLFEPPYYNVEFRPGHDYREYDVPEWPVLGGTDINPCGTVNVKITFSDERFQGNWFTYSEREGRMTIDPREDDAPGLTKEGKAQSIPFFYEAIYTFRGNDTLIHSEYEYITFNIARTQYKKKYNREKLKLIMAK